MSKTYISARLRHFVEERAGQICEYCLLPATVSFFPHEVDHIIAEKHGGKTEEQNLAYACWRCNRHKGSDFASFDPVTGEVTLLFNPRTQQWNDHFILTECHLDGLTPEGRTTVRLLQFNTIEQVSERKRLIEIRQYLPPSRNEQ